MPKKPITDPITDQEIAFALLILSGAMDDRRAAEAVGLNPSTAADTKSQPRVCAYMREHRPTLNEKLINHEAEALRPLNLGRDQILARLWHLANLNPEATRGSIAGQIKAMSMIVAIEGLIPDRRPSPVAAQSAPPPVPAKFYVSEAMRRHGHTEGAEQGDNVNAAKAQPAAPQMTDPLPTKSTPVQTTLDNPFLDPVGMNRVPEAMSRAYDADIHPAGPLKLAMPSWRNTFARGRRNP